MLIVCVFQNDPFHVFLSEPGALEGWVLVCRCLKAWLMPETSEKSVQGPFTSSQAGLVG